MQVVLAIHRISKEVHVVPLCVTLSLTMLTLYCSVNRIPSELHVFYSYILFYKEEHTFDQTIRRGQITLGKSESLDSMDGFQVLLQRPAFN